MALLDRSHAALGSSSPVVRSSLSGVAEQLQQLRGKARRLLCQQARVDSFLAESRPEIAVAELAQLTSAHNQARTEDARRTFARALNNKQDELKSRAELRAGSERLSAELAELQSALESTISRILSLDCANRSAEQGEADITVQLGELRITIEALEQALLEIHDP
jgi:chromosome segregation ATPase